MSKQIKVVGLDNLDKFKGKIDENLEFKADKNEIPTSLPANGGNADTVNGHTVLSDVPANAKFTDTTYSSASTSTAGLISTSTQTFAGNKTFNGQLIPNGASTCGTLQARKMASGTAVATSTNCPSGAWYGQYE